MSNPQQLIDAESGAIIVARLEVADTFWRRFRGLQFRSTLAADEGLLLTPCHAVHTHWMRFSIDVAMLDREGVVLAVFPNVRPWRFVRRVRHTWSIVESRSGVLGAGVCVGDRVKVTQPGNEDLRESGGRT